MVIDGQGQIHQRCLKLFHRHENNGLISYRPENKKKAGENSQYDESQQILNFFTVFVFIF